MTRTSRRFLAVLVLGMVAIVVVSVYGDVRALRDRVAGFGWWAFAAALALALVNYAVRFVRWSLYLRHQALAVPPAISGLVFVSGFALSITPGKLGELVKSYLLRASCGVPIARSAPVVIAERLTDLIALLVLGMAGVLLYGAAGGMAGTAGPLVAAGGAVVVSALVILSWPALARRLIDLVFRPRPLRRLAGRAHRLYDGLGELVRPRPLAWASALGVVAWLAECVGFAVIVSGFPGAEIAIGLATLIYAATTIAGALSFLPGGLLVTEAGMVVLLTETAHGVDATTAAAATVLTRLATLWFAVMLGVIALAVLRRVSPRAARALEHPEPAPDEPGEPVTPSNPDAR